MKVRYMLGSPHGAVRFCKRERENRRLARSLTIGPRDNQQETITVFITLRPRATLLMFMMEHHMSIGSSETTREPPFSHLFDFEDFLLHHLPDHKKTVDLAFLEWLVGFTEGDGSFISRMADGRPRLSFEITQKEIIPLVKIRNHLGFGRIVRSQTYFKFAVYDRRGLQRIMALFAGNLILPKRQAQFEAWVAAAPGWGAEPPGDVSSAKGPFSGPVGALGSPADLEEARRGNQRHVSLETGWLAGFLDAEGSFTAQLTRPSHRSTRSRRLCQKVHLTQQDLSGERQILVEVGKLLESTAAVRLVKAPNCYRLEICSRASQSILIDYLARFPLIAKALVYRRWWRVFLAREQQEHLSERGLRKLDRLCRMIDTARDRSEGSQWGLRRTRKGLGPGVEEDFEEKEEKG